MTNMQEDSLAARVFELERSVDRLLAMYTTNAEAWISAIDSIIQMKRYVGMSLTPAETIKEHQISDDYLMDTQDE
jgi:hypothetical protein